MKNWLSMDSTLRIFLKTNSSSCLRKIFNSGSIWLFEAGCEVRYIKKTKYHLDRDSRENGRFSWKNENPCLKNFSGVLGQKLALGEVEESQGFPKVKHSKYKNVFFTMYSLSRDLSGTIFIFLIGWAKTKIFGFEYFGLEVERSQPVDQKISEWFFSHLFPVAHRTHSN